MAPRIDGLERAIKRSARRDSRMWIPSSMGW